MEERINQLEQKIETLQTELKGLYELIGSGFNKTTHNFNIIGEQLDGMKKVVGDINRKVDELKGETTTGFVTVTDKLETLSDEISKISSVTGYDNAHENWKLIRGKS